LLATLLSNFDVLLKQEKGSHSLANRFKLQL